MTPLMIFIGAGLGGVARYGINILSARLVLATGFPFGTLVINIIGCFLMGCVVAFLPRTVNPAWLFPFLTTGLLGGFTTFSAFSLESVQLLQKQQFVLALVYMLASVIITVIAVCAGMALMRALGRS